MTPYFDSRDTRYRDPFGAVAAGTAVFFRIRLPRWLQCTAARLCVSAAAFSGQEPEQIPDSSMFWAGLDGDAHEWWECHYTHGTPALLRYVFALETVSGRQWLIRKSDGTAALSSNRHVPGWQLTCYDSGFSTPEWPAGGIMYQVFPDRFARSGEAKEGVPADRILHENWDETPEWRPDAQGEIRNNDYFGGDFKGIEQRLDCLAELGVTCLYLNPVFEAHSNHRYDTADYQKTDPLLGTEAALSSLLDTARRLGIRVLLDGVFSHTGADSVYFNLNGRYPGEGAAQSCASPYSSWYCFERWPDKYKCWWGFKTLPDVNETDPGFMEFICGENGVLRTRIRQGIGGWRLDVADELPDEFLDRLRESVKSEDTNAVILGEVWEDASNKESYGHSRRYLLGKQLDSVMNYPFRNAILHFLLGGPSDGFFDIVLDIVENYPPQVTRLLMNILGTHDTERILTLLAGEPCGGSSREWQASRRLSQEQRARGIALMRLASVIQYTLPGIPCIYYGDEAGMEGYKDPFNRGTYPWSREDAVLLAWYRRLGRLRRNCPALAEGGFSQVLSSGRVIVYERVGGDSRLLCAVNAGDTAAATVLPAQWHDTTVSLGGGTVSGGILTLPPLDCAVITIDI